ncbi:filamentation induced by camp protein fic [Chryseobacterium sp. StRB126]|nr:filamentation induced by camp protein fic [Chryseobacterium sp. StRB126]
MKPPYQITNEILLLIASISEKIGEINAALLYKPTTELRKKIGLKRSNLHWKLKEIPLQKNKLQPY